MRAAKLRICGPPYDQLAPAARRVPPVVHERCLRTERWPSRTRLREPSRTSAIGTVGRSSCSRGPTTQGLGFASLGAPRRATELGDTRGAFHRSATCDIRLGFRPARCDRQGRIHSFSPACGEYTAPFSTLAVTAALTNLRQRERGLLCDRDGPKSFWLRSGDGYPSDSYRTSTVRHEDQLGADTWRPNRLLRSE
jgi:hypothetical protein